jgi:acetyl-CoA acetyltransferase
VRKLTYLLLLFFFFDTNSAFQIVTGLNALRKRGGKVLVTSMCVGTGMGAAGVFVLED